MLFYDAIEIFFIYLNMYIMTDLVRMQVISLAIISIICFSSSALVALKTDIPVSLVALSVFSLVSLMVSYSVFKLF
jgi:hypothetical protein